MVEEDFWEWLRVDFLQSVNHCYNTGPFLDSLTVLTMEDCLLGFVLSI